MSFFDLRCGYLEIPRAEFDKNKTSFITSDELYEFEVVLFGPSNATATFEHMIDSVLQGMKWRICLCNLEDIIVASSNFKQRLQVLSQVL